MSRSPQPAIQITLSPAQVDQVLRAAAHSGAPGIASLVTGSLRRTDKERRDKGGKGTRKRQATKDERSGAPAGYTAAVDDRRLSRSLVRGLSILTCFGSGDEEHGILELAREADMSPSTAHRYALTLIELGLLERSPRSRKYRLPAAPPS